MNKESNHSDNTMPMKLREFANKPIHNAKLGTALMHEAADLIDRLCNISFAAYQVAGAHDADERILDVLCDPEAATDEQIEAMLPYEVPASTAQQAAESIRNALEEAAVIAEKIRFAFPASPTERAFNTGIESAAKCIRQAIRPATSHEGKVEASDPSALGVATEALRFYAEQQHFVLHQDVFETISGEPQNWQEDESNTIMFEDGSVAKQALETIAGAPRIYPAAPERSETPASCVREPSMRNKSGGFGGLPVAPTVSSSAAPSEVLRKELDGWKDEAAARQRMIDGLRAAANLRHQHDSGDFWYWQGDETDNLKSMSNGMAVLIRADHLRALLTDAALATPSVQAVAAPVPESRREALRDALSIALGEAMDCTRVWSAWGMAGGMRERDFQLLADNDERLEELVDAVLAVTPAASPVELTDAWQPIETAPKDANIIGYWKGYKRPCVMWWNFADQAWESWTDRKETPSHWMPLPPAPAISGDTAAQGGE